MPLPVLHSYAGYKFYKVFKSQDSQESHLPKWQAIASVVILANLADLDCLPQCLFGSSMLFHHGPTHSLLASLIVGGLVGLVVWIRKRADFLKSFLLASFIYFSHVVLDFFSCSHSVPLLWPLSAQRFGSPISLFPAAGMNGAGVRDFSDFADTLHSHSCMKRLLIELYIILGISLGEILTNMLEQKISRRVAAALSGGVVAGLSLLILAKTIGAL